MYRLFSERIILENVMVLSAPYLTDKTQLTASRLKQAYRQFLTKIQPHCPLMEENELFYADSETDQLFADYYSQSEVDMTQIYEAIDLNQVMYPDPLARLAMLKKVFVRMEVVDPAFTDLFKLIMNTVFCSMLQQLGGTSVNPRYIGVMCAHYDMQGDEEVLPEVLIHEFTHQTILLDELRYGHYQDYKKLKDPSTFINAKDRGVIFQFPLDRILHSMLVGCEIILARDAYVGHEIRRNQHLSTAALCERALKYISEIDQDPRKTGLLTQRGLELYHRVREFYTGR